MDAEEPVRLDLGNGRRDVKKFLPTKGWGPWRRDWYSVCSRHRHFDPTCRLCSTGFWGNHWWTEVSKMVFKRAPNLWVWCANLRVLRRK